MIKSRGSGKLSNLGMYEVKEGDQWENKIHLEWNTKFMSKREGDKRESTLKKSVETCSNLKNLLSLKHLNLLKYLNFSKCEKLSETPDHK